MILRLRSNQGRLALVRDLESANSERKALAVEADVGCAVAIAVRHDATLAAHAKVPDVRPTAHAAVVAPLCPHLRLLVVASLLECCYKLQCRSLVADRAPRFFKK